MPSVIEEISVKNGRLVEIRAADLMPLPPPYDTVETELTEPNPEWEEKYVTELDGYIAIDEPWKPKTEEEKEELVRRFLEGLKKLLDRENNWTFLQPLLLSLEYCARCQTCSDACHYYLASGKKEAYSSTRKQ